MKDATVYQLFDSDDNALYVGCTGGFQRRSYGHREKPWWTEVVRAEFSHHADRTEALAHEAADALEITPAELLDVLYPRTAEVAA